MRTLVAQLDRRPGLTGFAAFALVAAVARVADYAKPLGSDPAQFLYVGETVTRGGMPYADAAYNKGPLTALLFAAIDPVAGTSSAFVRATAVPFAALAALALAAYVAHHAGRWAGGLAGLLFAIMSGIDTYDAADVKTESYGVAPMFGALWMATRGGTAGAAGAGVLVACAALMNVAFVLIVPAVILELWLATPREERAGRFGAAAAAAAVPVVVVCVWLAAGGALDDALAQVGKQVSNSTTGRFGFLHAPLAGAGHAAAVTAATLPELRWRLPGSGLWMLAAIGCVAAARDPRLRRPALVLGVVMAATLLRVKAVHYEFVYHYYPALPAVCGAIALGIAALWPPRPYERVLLATLVLAFPVYYLVAKREGQLLRADPVERTATGYLTEPLAKFVRRSTRPDDPVYVASGRAEVYWRAERRSPTRYFDIHGLLTRNSLRERNRALSLHPPVAIVEVYPSDVDAALIRLINRHHYVRVYHRRNSSIWFRPDRAASVRPG